MKTFITLLILIFSCIGINAQKRVVNDYLPGIYRVKTANLNVRSAPNSSSVRLGKLSSGDRIEVQSVQNNWAQFLYDTKKAYVYAPYIEFVSELTSSTSDNELQSTEIASETIDNTSTDTISPIDKPIVKNSSTILGANDFSITVDSKNDNYGFMIGGDTGEYGYFNIFDAFHFGKYSDVAMTMGYGARYRFVDESIMFFATIFPYMGFEMYEIPKKLSDGSYSEDLTKEKFKFLYGAAANAKLGIKFNTTKSGNRQYLTLGYYIDAPEFKTKKIIENGIWCFGLTVIY